uniref:Purple acid phosphatase n=1 Tax=Bursaphelenchus xylophilus TaxID=6326 RepID=A0A1I7RWE2_BURXY
MLPKITLIGIVVVLTPLLIRAAPEQVHLSLCKEPDCMSISWVTTNNEPDQQLWFARDKNNLSHWRAADTKMWTFRGKTRYMHRKRIYNLRYDMTYYYQVGNNETKSKIFHFKTFPKGDDFPFKAAVVGDLGVKGKSLPYMVKAAQEKKYRLFILIGDLAYNLQTNQGRRGDQFMNMIEPIVAYVPFMVIPGNHEDDGENFANLRYRYDMPNCPQKDNQYYSFKVGPVQFIAVSSEYYVLPHKYGRKNFDDQYNWLKSELVVS